MIALALFLLWQATPATPKSPQYACLPQHFSWIGQGSEDANKADVEGRCAPLSKPAIHRRKPKPRQGEKTFGMDLDNPLPPLPATAPDQSTPAPPNMQGPYYVNFPPLRESLVEQYSIKCRKDSHPVSLEDGAYCAKDKPEPPDFTVERCDITALAGDCSYLFGWVDVEPAHYQISGGDWDVPHPWDIPLAKSMADDGWKCVITPDGSHFACDKRR